MLMGRPAVVADDDAAVRRALKEALRGAGCAVVGETRDTDDLMLRLDDWGPDLVVLDAALPGTLEPLLTIQRMRRKLPQLVVLVTGTASQNALLMEALSRGAADFLLKPIRARAVRDTLVRHL